MKTTKKGDFIQVFCKDLQEKLKALATYPRYLYEKRGHNGETFLYFRA